jgi:predicted amidohydrolase
MGVHVACVQMKPELGQYQINLSKMEAFVHQVMAEKPGTQLIVFPELITTGYECTKEQFDSMAEMLPSGNSMIVMGKLAKKYGVHLIYGFAERDPNLTDVLYNSSTMIDDQGIVLGRYRKVHPFDTEKQWCRPGCDYPLYDTKLGKIGVMICWDTGFPEVARSYALQGADLLVVCTNWEKPYSDDWDLITKARAFDNTLHLIAANRIGDDLELGFFGHSKIIDPVGREIAALDEEIEGYIAAELDLTVTHKERQRYYTFFKDRRPDTYEELVRKY